ncbi:MAG TPA: hypothetical protein DF292_05310 [Firmicutes bacterium]|jgi:hypothetical protein|nr:hypothetical protein [Bacillota bacterium]HCT36437.1 hypothetical protein [Bacillota bacterium]
MALRLPDGNPEAISLRMCPPKDQRGLIGGTLGTVLKVPNGIKCKMELLEPSPKFPLPIRRLGDQTADQTIGKAVIEKPVDAPSLNVL